MNGRLRTAAVLSLLGSAAAAQHVGDCSQFAAAEALVEPWEENSATFANGEVRLAVLDTIEPAAEAYHLLVLSPPYDEVGARQCRVISLGQGIGFAFVEMASLEAAYDPNVGLIFKLNTPGYAPDVDGARDRLLTFTLNQSSGVINAYLD
ncbi:MAG: hypothetical protein AAGA15_12520 [Pseudomonadota bacterium]